MRCSAGLIGFLVLWMLTLEPLESPVEERHDPLEAGPLALAALADVPLQERIYQRFLWLGSVDSKTRTTLVSALRGHIPVLATESDLVPPVEVANGLLLRLDAHAQGDLFLKVWERLADLDPYFHINAIDVTTEIKVTTVQGLGKRVWFTVRLPRDGAPILINDERTEQQAGLTREFRSPEIAGESKWTFTVDGHVQPITASPGDRVTIDFTQVTETKSKRRVLPGLEPLVAATQSEAPLLDAGWFLAHTAIQEGRGNAGYYDFLGIKDRKAFEALIAFDGKLAKGARFTEFLEAVAQSHVAQQPRRIQREWAIGGGYWRTLDNAKAVEEKNPLRILDRKLFKHAAEEAIGFKANGFWATALFVGNAPVNAQDQDGNRQNSAPDFIGYTTAHGLDGRIHAGMGCVACHLFQDNGADRGLITFDPWIRDIFAPGADNPFALTRDYDRDAERLKRQQYFRPFQAPMEADRARHEGAILEATGLQARAWGQAYIRAYNDYEGGIDLARASRYWGASVDTVKDKAIAAVRAGQVLDPVIAGLVRGKRVGIRQFEEVYPLGLALIKGKEQKP